MTNLRGRLSFANVVSVIALFVALGGTGYAAFNLPKNSVGPKQLKRNSVTTAKIRNGAISGAKLKNDSLNGAKVSDGSLTGADVQDNSLTGADINQASLNNVRAANVIKVSINRDEDCTPSQPLPPGVSSRRDKNLQGECELIFPNPLTQCAATVTIHRRFQPNEAEVLQSRDALLWDSSDKPTILHVDTFEGSTMMPLPFDLVLVC